MKKWCMLFVTLLAAVTLCVRAQGADPTDAPEPITYWTWQSAGEELAEDYGVANAHRPVSVRRFASGAELYQALLSAARDSGSDLPDAFRLEYAFLPLLREQGALLSLERWLRPASTAFPAWALKQVSFAGLPYAVPVDTAPVGLVYRADLLARYGARLPTTWAQAVTAAQKVWSASKGTARLLNADLSNSLWWLALASAGGSRAWGIAAPADYTQRLNDAAASALAATLQGLVARDQVTRLPSGGLEEARALRDGRVVMAVLPVPGAVSLAKVLRSSGTAQYRVAALPGLSTADWGGSGCALGTRTVHAEAAAAFCLWLAQDAGAQRKSWTRDGLLAVAPTGSAVDPTINAFYGGQDVGGVYARLAGRVQSQTWVPWLPLADAVYRQLMRRVQNGELTITEALERWQATVASEARKLGYTLR